MKSVSWLTFLAAVGFCALAAGPARATPTYTFFTLTFDENGNCTSTFGTCPSTTAMDPTGAVTGHNVLIYTLPEPTFSGRVDIRDLGVLSDQLAFVDVPPGSTTGSTSTCPLGSGTLCANEMIFYSLDSLGALADVGPQSLPKFSAFVKNEPNEHFVFEADDCAAGAPNCNNFIGTSDGAVPIPTALPLFATGLGGLGLLDWRRKRKARAVA